MSGVLAPSSPTAAQVTIVGITAPTFAEVRDYLVSQFQLIYGEDIVTTPDTQDGQLISVFALAIADANAACIQVYNGFSPSTSQGVGLSSMVKINGLTRALPSHSSVLMRIEGIVGTSIINGQVQDNASNRWNLPPSVIIPPDGRIDVTATAAVPGDLMALEGTINRIATITYGWQTATNITAATPGAPVESDAALRVRQSQSTANPSRTVLAGITGGVLALNGVTACKPYENDTNVVDPVTTLPPHSIAMVVVGGDSMEICQAILLRKTPGCFTYGSVRNNVFDNYDLPHDIGFFIPSPVAIGVAITITAGPGYTSMVGAAISKSVADYIGNANATGLGSGEWIIWSKLWLPANMCDAAGRPFSAAGETYDITALTVGKIGQAYGMTNIPIQITEIPQCVITDVVVTVV